MLLYEKIALFFDPGLVQIQHDGVARFVGIGYVRHEHRVDGIAAVRAVRVIEVYDIELRADLVLVLVVQQRVVGNGGEVIEFIVVDIDTESFGNHLFNVIVHYRIGLS